MKVAYVIVIIIAAALAYALWDFITRTIDMYTFLALAIVIVLSVRMMIAENREQQS